MSPSDENLGRNFHQILGLKFWFVVDGVGMMVALFTYTLMTFAHFVVLDCVLLRQENVIYVAINATIFELLFFMAVASHLRTMCSDPGSVGKKVAVKQEDEPSDRPQDGLVNTCEKCSNVKPERAHHCSVCQRCIRKMDHHCPWVNNCVGEGNQKYFVLFNAYIVLLAIHGLIVGLPIFIKCIENDVKGCPCNAGQPEGKLNWIIVATLALAVLFGTFAFFMCFSQICSILLDRTYIERRQGRSYEFGGMKHIRAVFGNSAVWWILPFKPISPPKVKKGETV